MADSLKAGWPEWKASDWNAALFHHFFTAAGRNAGPVTRLVVTPEELRKATGDRADPRRVRQAFLHAARLPPPAFRRAVSTNQLAADGEWQDAALPPFVMYLVFTCFVASTIEGEVIQERDFRNRLRILLDHPAGTGYPLDGLASLWRAFARWLDRRRRAGAPYRALILPDPGHMVRIGYSIRLAFPRPNDQIRLIQLVNREAFDRDPPIPAVVNAIAKQIGSFSSEFQDTFERFREAYLRGDADIDNAFWSAVRDATAHGSTPFGAESGRARFQLFMEIDAESWADLLVTASVKHDAGKSVRMVKAEIPLETYPYIVAIDGAKDGPRQAARLLLEGVLDRVLPSLRRSPVWIAVQQGVLLFRRNEAGLRELATSRPEEGKVWALVRHDLAGAFQSLLSNDHLPTAVPSRYPSWNEFSSFDASLLTRLRRRLPSSLTSVRCLQPTVSTAQIHLSGGVLIAGGYLGLPDCLPIVRVPGGDTVVLFAVEMHRDGVRTTERVRLQRATATEDTYEFPKDKDLVLDGRFTLTAWSAGTLIAQRQVNFRKLLVWDSYAKPTDPNQWLVEAAGPDMAAPTTNPDAPEALDEFTARSIQDFADCGSSNINPRSRELTLPAGAFPTRSETISHDQVDPDADEPLARFIEICAGLAINKKGISEPEFLDRLGDALGIDSHELLWDVVRAWVEAGYFDSLTRRTWKNRAYFARDPRLVLWRTGSTCHATLMGLASRGVRTRVRKAAEAHGLRARATTSFSRLVPSLLSWSADSKEMFDRIRVESELRHCHWLMPSNAFISSVAKVASEIELEGEPLNYERRGSWDWDRGRFTREPVSGGAAIDVDWYERSDRPPYFLVRRDGLPYWKSHSRNWALLVAYTLRRAPPFEKVGSISLRRRVTGQVYLPLPLARAIAATAETVPGTSRLADGRWTYTYSLTSPIQRAVVLRLLWCSNSSAKALRRARWLLGLISDRNHRPSERLIPLPPLLRAALEQRVDIPDIVLLAAIEVPPFILPHIRMLGRGTEI